MRILVINGPNLNLLGKREPEKYGKLSLWDIENQLKEKFDKVKFEFYQSNVEGEIVNFLQKAMDGMTDGVILNAGGYTHTSVAIRDAVAALKVSVIEVHLTNPQAREEFRHNSLMTGVCKGVIAGFGALSYELAVRAFIEGNS
ncbi:MAG: type II 3-dehydroquinate dehydratase [Ignavibacteriales bacterium]|nr:type II 3-dehydroquinate dehydratase [Ignavibacteriales bacterium]